MISLVEIFWMRKIDLKNQLYWGDIVTEVIKSIRKSIVKKNIKFCNKDLITETIEKYDVIFVRDCFVHLSDKEIILLRNICDSKSIYLISFFKKLNNSEQKN